MVALPINLFDCIFVTALVAGLVVGRRKGIALELLPLLKWLTLILFSAVAYHPLGSMVSAAGFFDPFWANVLAYLACALVIFLIFSKLQRKLVRRIEGTDKFGRTEYYLGMGSGCVRYGCMLILGLALLNAREFSQQDIKQAQQYQEHNFGSSVFPTVYSLQEAVFEKSLTGSLIRNYLGFLLITPTNPHEPLPATQQVTVGFR